MAEKLQLIFEIVTKDGQAAAVLKNIEQQAKKTEQATDKIGDSFSGLNTTVIKLVPAFTSLSKTITGIGFALAGALGGFTFGRAIDEAVKLENALIGLSSIAKATGNSVDFITSEAKRLAADGIIPLSEVSTSLKNLLSTGLDGKKAVEAFEALRDSATFGRQANLSLGEAVRGATEGIKNQNSTLVDNAGVTKNISNIIKDYAASIGKSVVELTDQQKVLAITNGVISESRNQIGDYTKSLDTFGGQVSKITGRFQIFLGELGRLIIESPVVISGLAKFSSFLDVLISSFRGVNPLIDKAVASLASFSAILLVIQRQSLFNFLSSLASGFTALAASISATVVAMGGLVATLKLLGAGLAAFASITTFLEGLIQLKREFGSISNSIEAFGLGIKITLLKASQSFDPLLLKLQETRIKFQEFVNEQAEKLGVGFRFTILDENDDKLKKSIEGVNFLIRKAQDDLLALTKNTGQSIEDTGRKISSENNKVVNDLNKNLANSASVSFTSLNKETKALIANLQKELDKTGKTEIQILQEVDSKRLALVESALKKGILSKKQAADLEFKIDEDFIEKLSILKDKERKNEADERRKDLELEQRERQEAIRETGNLIITPWKAVVSLINRDIKPSFANIASTVAGVGKSLTSGAKSFISTLSVGLSATFGVLPEQMQQIADAFLETFGAAPEEFRQKLYDTIVGIPQLIGNIITNVATLVSGQFAKTIATDFVAQIPTIVQNLTYSLITTMGSPAFWISAGIAFVKALGQALLDSPQAIIDGFKKGFEDVAKGFRDIFSKSLLSGLEDFGKKFLEYPKKFGEELRDQLEKINPINLLSKLFKFDGGGKGPVERLLGLDFPFLAFAKGGRVPGVSKVGGDSLRNDTIPALLSPGEIVIPKSVVSSDTGKMFEFLQSAGYPIKGFGFGKKLGGFVGGVVGGITGAIGGIVDAVGGVFGGGLDIFSTTLGLDKIIDNLSTGLADIALGVADATGLNTLLELFEIFTGIGVPKDIFEAFKSLVKLGAKIKLLDFIKNPVKGAENAILSIVDVFQPNFQKMVGLQQGGEPVLRSVPQGFPSDSYGARLTSGEMVVDRTTTNQLKDFLRGNQTNDNDSLLLEVINLLRKPMQVESKVELDGRAFANILLDLSRTNSRITV